MKFGILLVIVLIIGLLVFFLPTDMTFHGPRDKKIIALTFDDGPDKSNTPQILDILKQNNASATFFVIGKNIHGNEELLKRIAAEGHELGVHSYSHSYLFLKNYNRIYSDMYQTNVLIYNVTGKRANIFRPPYGILSPFMNKAAKKLDLHIVLWDVFSYDYKNQGEERIISTVLEKAKSGSIVVFHDTGNVPRNQTISALERIIPELRKQDYDLVTVSEIMHKI
ncbi:polysaccharide deacetylase family protein [Candidatus Woesearchaeota archaeon]|nr:polysaccharide deacetylase family protein [Candidatus Woesearchaeota archaeon]